jgi:phospholipid/cholesterol/gamma-HCH transport system substrate-binding protein
MSRSANPALIGAFVLGAAAIAVGALLFLGSGRYFENRQLFMLYFDEPVTGLSVGAPVIFQGVAIGDVTEIQVVVDNERDVVEIPVTIALVSQRVQLRGGSLGSVRAEVEKQVERGLRARLATQSILTGQLYVSLDFHPEKPAKPKRATSGLPEIPTIPSELTEIRNTFSDLVAKLRALPLEDMVGRLASASAGIDRLVNKPQLASAIDQLDATLGQLRSTVARIDRRIEPLADQTQATMGEARKALVDLDATLRRLESMVADTQQLVDPSSPLQVQLLTALEELAHSARAVRTLAEGLAQEPDAILFGRGQGSDAR